MPSQTIPVTFVCDSWTETPVPGFDGRVAVLDGKFVGEMAGRATGCYVLSQHAVDPETWSFNAQWAFDGTLQGKPASFVMHKQGTQTGMHFQSVVKVIPETVKGDIKGLTGTQHWDIPEAGPGASADATFTFEME